MTDDECRDAYARDRDVVWQGQRAFIKGFNRSDLAAPRRMLWLISIDGTLLQVEARELAPLELASRSA